MSDLARLRREYRSGSNLFAAALIACRDKDFRTARVLADELQPKHPAAAVAGPKSYTDAIQQLVGLPADEYLRELADRIEQPSLVPNDDAKAAAAKVSGQISKIETDVGISIQRFVESVADMAAFDEFTQNKYEPPRKRVFTMFPVCTVIKQDARSLTTRATVTTIVDGDYDDLVKAIDPARWSRSSDIIRRSEYVTDPFELTTAPVQISFGNGAPPSGTFNEPRLLNEHVEVSWDPKGNQRATYHNVLNIRTSENDLDADVYYNLCRSITSSVLWDRRPGGLLLDQGYIKLRHLRDTRYRLTVRKEVRFADRTPCDNPIGWRDFGELTNYLAPATLSCWLESEMYSMADPTDEGPSGEQPFQLLAELGPYKLSLRGKTWIKQEG